MKRRHSSSNSLPHKMSLRTFSRQEKMWNEAEKNQEIFLRQDLSRRNLYSYCSNICSLCLNCKTKTNKKFADIIKKFMDFQNFQKSYFVRGKYLKIRSLITFLWVTRAPTKNLGPIGSAVLTFIGYKTQTNKQTPRQAKFIYT